jgi:hypothetical protein
MRARQIQNPNDLLGLESFKQIDESAQLLLRHVRPIFVFDEKGRPQLEASGIPISADNKRFIVTAAHVTDALERSSLYMAGTASKQTLKLGGDVFSSIAEGGS